METNSPLFISSSLTEKAIQQTPNDLLTDFDHFYRAFQSLVFSSRNLHNIGPSVAIFGSAYLDEGHEYYILARAMGQALAAAGYAVITGGGPGAMEAANRGAKEAGGISIGCNIVLPKEQALNSYLDCCLTFDCPFVRKIILRKYSCAFVLMPGGIGTLDEIFETATLYQTGKHHSFPIILMGREYWEPVQQAIWKVMYEAGTFQEAEVGMMITDSPVEAVAHITRAVQPVLRPGA